MSDKDAYPVLDLFAGYGGFSLAFEAVAHAATPRRTGAKDAGADRDDAGQNWRWGQEPERGSAFRTIAFSEIDPSASAILAHRWPTVPNLGDVRDITADSVLRECGVLPVVVTGGFPCQPHSHAGKRQASLDERDLWDECARVLGELRPRFALFENVAGLLSSESGLFFNRVLSDLAEIGYGCQWETLSAAAIGAPHRRERIWLLCWDERLADSPGAGCEGGIQARVGNAEGRQESGNGQPPASGDYGLGLADTDGQRGDEGSEGATGFWPAAHGLWPARPGEPQYEWEPSRTTGGLGHTSGGVRLGTTPRTDGHPALTDEGGIGWQTQPRLGGNANGPPAGVDAAPVQVHQAASGQEDGTVNRTHRLKALGNGIVPLCALPFAMAIYRMLEEG